MEKTEQEKIIYDYINDNGAFLICSSDSSFNNLIRSVIFSITGNKNRVISIQDFNKILDVEKLLLTKHSNLMIFVDKYFYGETTLDKLNTIKNVNFKRTKVVSITNECDRNLIYQILEMGADSVIMKPISIRSLIEKIVSLVYDHTNISLSKYISDCEAAISAKEFTKAEKLIKNIFNIKTNSCIGFMLSGDLEKAQGNYTKSEQFYLRAIEKASLFLEPLEKIINLYGITNNSQKKLEYLLKLDLLSPLNYKRKIDIGLTYMELDQPDNAELYFAETINQVKNEALDRSASVLMDIAKELKNKNPDLAIKYINQAISLKSDNLTENDLWMFNKLGQILQDNNRWEEAVSCYRTALKINPNKGCVYYQIGLSYLLGGSLNNAIDNFELGMKYACSLLVENSDIGYNIGFAYYKINDFTNAIYYLNKCLEVNPNCDKAKELIELIREKIHAKDIK